mmetsp:Transcript_9207/g.21541  ORF Transcript_9207/g.21541 Transcript_9207/m.21541 type:complete len:356 (-) Transcript_9207:287-1354(-)
MCTSSRVTLTSVSSSSSTICVPSDVEVGQQLKDTGRKLSSELLSCHFRSGAGALARKARDGSRTSRMLLAWDALFKFGCTLYLNSWFCGASLKQTRSALAVSRTVTLNSPVQTASPFKPPSTCSSAVIFSSISTFTGSNKGFTTAGAAGSTAFSSPPSCCGAGSAIPKPPSMSPGRFLPRAMPFFGAPGFKVAGPVSSDMDALHGGAGVDDSTVMLLLFVSLKGMLWKEVASPPVAGSFGCMTLFANSICFLLASSLASLILLCSIIWWSFSSWLSISVYVLICERVTLSLWPNEITSSKANTMSKACLRTCSSLTWIWQQSCTTFASSLKVSRSSRMLLALFVTSTRCRDSIGW